MYLAAQPWYLTNRNFFICVYISELIYKRISKGLVRVKSYVLFNVQFRKWQRLSYLFIMLALFLKSSMKLCNILESLFLWFLNVYSLRCPFTYIWEDRHQSAAQTSDVIFYALFKCSRVQLSATMLLASYFIALLKFCTKSTRCICESLPEYGCVHENNYLIFQVFD